MGWPGSGVAFVSTDQDVAVEITDDGAGYMDLRVGDRLRVIDLQPGRHRYEIVGKADYYAPIRLTRRSESYDTGLFTLNGLITGRDGAVPLKDDRMILFVGDSITAGFGVAGDTKDCANTPAMHSPTQSYAMMTAEMLDAEPHLVAISGRGVVHNWDSNPAPVMPAQIDFALPDSDAAIWDHDAEPADVIVTLLGTNDWSVIDPGQDRFRAGYRDMLSNLRARYPDAHIVTVSGPLLGGEQGAAIRDGIDFAMEALSDTNISTLDLSLSAGPLRWSCNSHPGRASMAQMAVELAAHISRQVGWDGLSRLKDIAPPEWMLDGGKEHFNTRIAQIASKPMPVGVDALLGDSITEGWQWHQDSYPYPHVNHGVGWDVVQGQIARLPQVLQQPDPTRYLIKIGTNDLSYERNPALMASELRQIVTRLKTESPDARITVQSVLPREADKRPAIAQVNRLYAEVAAAEGVEWLDLTDDFSAADGTLKPELTDDALHLNAAGYEVWGDAIRRHDARVTTP